MRLLTAAEVRDLFFGGHISEKWIRRNLPGKRTLGHCTVRWFEHEVRAWLLERGSE